MGLSSNQARFLSLTSRQIDMEQRIQQICQRRLRLSSELENVATSYNNSISNRKMFTASQTNSGIKSLSVDNLAALGYKVIDNKSNQILKAQQTTTPSGFTSINTQADFMNLVSTLNSGSGLNGKYILNCDIDLSGNTYTQSLIHNTFTGTFDGNGHTVNNLSINTAGAAINNVGLFSNLNGATVENVQIKNANINAANSSYVGALAGYAVSGTNISNCYVSSTINGGIDRVGGVVGGADWSGDVLSNITADVNVTGAGQRIGGISGSAFGNTLFENCESSGSVTATGTCWGVGGIVGDLNGSTVSSCASSAAVSGESSVGGLVGLNCSSTTTNSYSTGSVSASGSIAGTNENGSGGLVGINMGGGQVMDSYTTATVNNCKSGFIGSLTSAGDSTNSFYDNNMSGTSYGAVDIGSGATSPVASWSSAIWDKSTTLPTLNNVGYKAFAEDIEKNLRNGTYSLAKDADEFTQNPITLGGDKYEEVDWRTAPEVYDELYGSDDTDAENKYDKTIDEINSQDKKLQLEQTSIETEYKAVSSEREAVKKILDTNASSSFKYFS